GIVELLENERDVHPRLPGITFRATVDPVLADERERVGEQIERHGETPARAPHHRFVTFEGVVVLVEDGHYLLCAFAADAARLWLSLLVVRRSSIFAASMGAARRGSRGFVGAGEADRARRPRRLRARSSSRPLS